MSQKITIGLLQMRCAPRREGESPSEVAAENLARASEKIREAVQRGAQIVCTHELFRSEYFCRTEDAALFDLAEPVPGPATDALAKVARENKVAIVASLFERRAPGIYHNTCAVIDADGSFLGKYRKMHIPDDPLYYEKFYFTPGDLGFPNFDMKCARIAVQICWDQWYPEGSRAVALGGAQVIFYPTSIAWHPKEKAEFGAAQLDAWKTIQRGHAIANGVYVAVVNRVGFEGPSHSSALRQAERSSARGGAAKLKHPSTSYKLERVAEKRGSLTARLDASTSRGVANQNNGPGAGDTGLEFWGNSFVADPFGRVVAEASNDKEEVLVVECDPTKSEDTRRNWPFLRDRRVDAYEPILNRWLGK